MKYSDDHQYLSVCQNLPEIPKNIPEGAMIIKIQGNKDITALKPNTFNKYSKCARLHLSWNRIQVIENKTFTGLIRLQRLHLEFNMIHRIYVGSFAQLTSNLHIPDFYLDLRNNSLTTFSKTLFGSHSSSNRLELGLGGNNLECNSSLCWLKWAELDGWLTWLSEKDSKPACLNTHTFFDNTCGSKYYLMLPVFEEYKHVKCQALVCCWPLIQY